MSPRVLAAIQAGYLVASGAWPFLHRESFEAVTGKKQDFWLVQTVGGLAIATGLSVGVAAQRGARSPETGTSALASGLVFVLADLHAALSKSRAYLADAILQMAFATSWLRRWNPASRPTPIPGKDVKEPGVRCD